MMFILAVVLMASWGVYAQVALNYDTTIPVYLEGSRMADPWAGGLNAAQYGRIDLNGDGKEDLVIFDRSASLLSTFIYAEGKYKFDPDYRIYLPDDLQGWILFRDYDCDGMKDIFTHSTSGMRVFRNTGNPSSVPQWELVADPVLTKGASGTINLQVNITDVPGIEDLDGDGDLDILVYNYAIGGFIRHHKNLSFENYGSCDKLEYELVSRNWGYFEECICHIYAFEVYGESCEELLPARIMHPGGKSLLLIDMDNDGDKDFLGGHEQCDEFYFLENEGTPEEAIMRSFSEDFPDSEHPVNFPIFPAGFWDDFDDDGIHDLLVSPNTEYNLEKAIDYRHSSWFYKNIGSNDLPQFNFVTPAFLQADMIDLGENTRPVIVDEDGDGDLDLLVGSNGFPVEGTYYGHMSLFENTGSPTDPEFHLKDQDYLEFSQSKQFDVMPMIADLNHDGTPDLVMVSVRPDGGTVETRWYRNMGEPGSGLSFDTNYDLLELDLNDKDTPYFTDVNEDGMVDLLIGRSTGRLEYHVNQGSDQIPFFVLEDPAFLGIDDSYIEFKRNLVPFVTDIDLNGQQDLLTTDYTGVMTAYLNYKTDPIKMSRIVFNDLLEESDTSSLGTHTWLTGGLISGLENPVIIAGDTRGGLMLFRNIADNSHEEPSEIMLSVFPNPLISSDILTARSTGNGELLIFNNLGQQVESPIEMKAYRNHYLDIGYMPQGMYIFKIIDREGRSDEQLFIRY